MCWLGDPSKPRFRISIQARTAEQNWPSLTGSERHIRATLSLFFYHPHILGPTNPPISKMALDPAEIDQIGHWTKTSSTRHITRNTTKSQTTKTEQVMNRSNRKNKRPSWTRKFSVSSTKESGNPRPMKNYSNQMETSLLDKKMERNQGEWNSKAAQTIKMKMTKMKMKIWTKKKTTKTNNSW